MHVGHARPPPLAAPLMGAAASLPFLTQVYLPHHSVIMVAAVAAPTGRGGQYQWGGGGSSGRRGGSTDGGNAVPVKGATALVAEMGSSCEGRSPGREGQNL